MFLPGRIGLRLRGRLGLPGGVALVVAAALSAGALSVGTGSAGAAPAETREAEKAARKVEDPRRYLRGFDPLDARLEGDGYRADLPHGRSAELTLDPGLQQHVRGVLERYQVPHAGVVALQPDSGRVLAYVSHHQGRDRRDMVLDPSPPAASVFKLITSAALLENGMSPDSRACYHGGFSGLEADHLRDDPRYDRCVSLSYALGFSLNAVFAKMAVRHLSPRTLWRYADAFGFGQRLPFDTDTSPGKAEVPKERLEFARTAAGFWHMHMSPLHGALIAATVGNRGRMMRPAMVERVKNRAGNVVYAHAPELHRHVLERRTAELLGRMMRTTVERGTAHKTFFDEQGNAFLPGIEVAGKTGTLSEERPYRGYTWWVGFAPAHDPEIAVAALVVNSPKWRIKAAYAAREALRYYLVEKPREDAPQAGADRPVKSADPAG